MLGSPLKATHLIKSVIGETKNCLVHAYPFAE